jgi:hypothetical protein
MPAKMLGLNPGLKEITHSITGGSIAAQGMFQPSASSSRSLIGLCRLLDAIHMCQSYLRNLLLLHRGGLDSNLWPGLSVYLHSSQRA